MSKEKQVKQQLTTKIQPNTYNWLKDKANKYGVGIGSVIDFMVREKTDGKTDIT